MRTETVKIYTFDELSEEGKQNAFEYARANWHDLGQHEVDEIVYSLKALAEKVYGNLDYAISIVPDRGEFIKITGFCQGSLEELYKVKDDCPLTGICYDIDVIEGLMAGELEHVVLKVLHAQGEYLYSDEGLSDFIRANDYEFTVEGKIYV